MIPAKIAVALLALSVAMIVGLLFASAVYARSTSTTGEHSYDELLDMGYGIIKHDGNMMLVQPEFAATYLDVAYCESRHDEKVEGLLGERGFLQIHPVHKDRIERLGFTWDDMYQLWPNLVVAYDIWLEQGFNPWSCAHRLGVV